ncbi:MAG: acetyl-CoA carboxylase biotin carboxyl carrier protein subunit [Chitinophagales bacterium]|nr:acetyl-CoA carboxylase biotin carboxyl carrier protein subunit [Chitinophagales bacterium]MDW8274392.1 acetyl-CoA carboxylase biotin carboxyl carrier protein subunit [Chitinophagales bacterium]
MLHVSVGEKKFTFEDKQAQDADITWLSPRTLHILYQNQSFTAELIGIHPDERKLIIRINNKEAEVFIKTGTDLMLEKLGMTKGGSLKHSHLNAPMPGLILQVHAEEGKIYHKGESLLVLEAMKMENALKAPATVKVKKVCIKAGQAVEKGEKLIEFE